MREHMLEASSLTGAGSAICAALADSWFNDCAWLPSIAQMFGKCNKDSWMGCDAWFYRGLSARGIDGRLTHRPSV
jgi:hypothetical protein